MYQIFGAVLFIIGLMLVFVGLAEGLFRGNWFHYGPYAVFSIVNPTTVLFAGFALCWFGYHVFTGN